jgi:hypothetical protein
MGLSSKLRAAISPERKAEFDAGLRAQRDKTARLSALRLARDEAKWLERRQQAMADIKDGLVALREKTAQLIERRCTMLYDSQARSWIGAEFFAFSGTVNGYTSTTLLSHGPY